MTKPMDYDQYRQLSVDAADDFLAGHAETLAALAFIRAAVPLLRTAQFIAQVGGYTQFRPTHEQKAKLDALIASFPDDFGETT